MRKINKIIIHCSDSDIDKHDNIYTIRRWHLSYGWRDVGYHYFVRKGAVVGTSGVIEIGRLEKTVGAHTYGENRDSIGVCLSGKTNFMPEQFESTAKLLTNLCNVYNLDKEDIYPHYFFDNQKTCPNFNLLNLTNLM